MRPASQGLFQVIDDGQQTREYRRRRPHKKSRGGCAACKQRRVKCDQTVPTCQRCSRNQRACVYEQPLGDGPGGSLDGSAGPDRGRASRQGVPPAPLRLLLPPPLPTGNDERGTPSAALLHHYETAGAAIYGMPTFIGALLPLAAGHVHLRATLLAVAAAHLCHGAPAVRAYRVAEAYQQALALQAYQQALDTPLVQQGQAGVDALLLTAMNMNMLAFVLPVDPADAADAASTSLERGTLAARDADPRRSWVFSPHPNRLGWLAVVTGLTPLLAATAPWRATSRLAPLYANSDDERRTLSGTWQSVHRVPQPWLDLFGIDRHRTPRPRHNPTDRTVDGRPPNKDTDTHTDVYHHPTEADRLYRGPLRVLAEVWPLPANGRTMLAYFQFMGKLEPGIRRRLLAHDEKTLWLFGVWMGLMCRHTHVWWVARRARCDFRAIRLWLHLAGVDRRPGAEGRLWQVLLRDMDRTWAYDFAADEEVQQLRARWSRSAGAALEAPQPRM